MVCTLDLWRKLGKSFGSLGWHPELVASEEDGSVPASTLGDLWGEPKSWHEPLGVSGVA